MSNVPDDFMQYHCRVCGETPCDCGGYCQDCGEELEGGECPICDSIVDGELYCSECGLEVDLRVEKDGRVLCGPCYDKEEHEDHEKGQGDQR